jgi:hypothetical protein
MKTSDLHIAESGGNGAGGTLRAFFSLDWLGAKSRKKTKSKLKVATPSPQGGAPGDSKTKVDQSAADVLKLLRADGVRRLGVFGDRGFAELMAAQGADLSPAWISTDFVSDIPAGARRFGREALQGLDAIVVGGADLATRYRFALREVATIAPELPVHWVANGWEFCGGTAAIPAEIDDVDALVWNHFEEFFGIKDSLQFRFEVISESGIKRSYRILGPNESVNLNLNTLAGVGPDGRRAGPVCLKIWVAHPFLTRGRHYRFRICGDVYWKDSFTIIHGSHQFFKNPNRLQEFRLIDTVIRKQGHVLMTVPNYDLDMGADDTISIRSGAGKSTQRRSRKRPVEVVDFERKPTHSAERQYFAAAYRGYGTSFWYALEEGFAPGRQGSIAANHLCRVGIDDRADIAFKPEELDIVKRAIDAGFMINPVTLPVLWGKNDLGFGFNFDASNPPFADYLIRYYDVEGKHLGEHAYHKDFVGAVLIEEVVRQWNHPDRTKVATALVAPDHLKAGLAPQRLVTTADMLVRHLKTGDQDYTEFQNSWRNLGAVVPTLPHWLHPSIGVIGRTNVMGRVRTKNGYRTGVYIANGSGNLRYEMTAEAEISAINNAGRRLSHYVTLPAFGTRVVWLDDVLPDLAQHVGPSGAATLQVKSADADLTAHVIGVSPSGAVGVQHLWGY